MRRERSLHGIRVGATGGPTNEEGWTSEKEAVRNVRADELRQVAAVIARAFYDDPPTCWTLPNDEQREILLSRGLYFYLRKLWFPQGECLTTPGVVGAATWLPPGGWKVSPIRQVFLLPGLALAFGRSTGRVLSAIASMESNQPEVEHFYLPFAGVLPEWQGKGIGSALLSPVLQRCDRDAIPAYLEASSPLNRRLYERHGFEVTEEFRFAQGAPPLWRMWRSPRPVRED